MYIYTERECLIVKITETTISIGGIVKNPEI